MSEQNESLEYWRRKSYDLASERCHDSIEMLGLARQITALKAQRDELLAEVEEWRAIKAAYLIECAARPNKFHPRQYHGHAHYVDGIWDRDNGALAGCQCVACMVHRVSIANAEKDKT